MRHPGAGLAEAGVAVEGQETIERHEPLRQRVVSRWHTALEGEGDPGRTGIDRPVRPPYVRAEPLSTPARRMDKPAAGARGPAYFTVIICAAQSWFDWFRNVA
jgi:hypothetical protein